MANNPDLAEHYAPAHVHRLIHHYHNLIYIKNYWESIGQIAPKWVMEELGRSDKEIQEVLDREKQQGGFLHNRGKEHETRKR